MGTSRFQIRPPTFIRRLASQRAALFPHSILTCVTLTLREVQDLPAAYPKATASSVKHQPPVYTCYSGPRKLV